MELVFRPPTQYFFNQRHARYAHVRRYGVEHVDNFPVEISAQLDLFFSHDLRIKKPHHKGKASPGEPGGEKLGISCGFTLAVCAAQNEPFNVRAYGFAPHPGYPFDAWAMLSRDTSTRIPHRNNALAFVQRNG